MQGGAGGRCAETTRARREHRAAGAKRMVSGCAGDTGRGAPKGERLSTGQGHAWQRSKTYSGSEHSVWLSFGGSRDWKPLGRDERCWNDAPEALGLSLSQWGGATDDGVTFLISLGHIPCLFIYLFIFNKSHKPSHC